jgi:hypothetical protein
VTSYKKFVRLTEPDPINTPTDDSSRTSPNLAAYLAVCPFVGLYDDVQTHSNSADVTNYCHRRGRPRSIRSEYLTGVCLGSSFSTCTVYENRGDGDTPSTQVNEHLPYPFHHRKSLLRRIRHNWQIVMVGLLLTALAILVWLTVQNGGFAFASRHDLAIFLPPLGLTATPRPILPGLIPTPDPQSTYSQVTILSATPHPLVFPSSTHASSPLPSLTLLPLNSHQLTAALPPGPLAETPFGRAPVGNGPMLVHIAKRGDTWELLARQYDTSMPVLQAINPRGERKSIWEGEPLVILPGVKEAAGLGPLKATMIDGHWEISPQFP